ncbi:hypothetical protein BA190_10580 [Labrys sp. WJW]|uniref:hypothetical protein n=1 Tax=Labrys sp. WJW TaxID=1737983 RepID=UPI000834A624|nr:hypothetical protein [Labrys sp. WJW]OCC05033.1 hypothetical protein BA190_10580 [Labrys sp. WJW]
MLPKGPVVGLLAAMAGLMVMAVPAEAALCYARDYDAAHLVKHVEQRVTRITVRLLADNGSGIGIGLWFRGDKRQWWAGGGCRQQGAVFTCTLDGDGGKLTATQNAKGIRLDVPGAGIQVEHPDAQGNASFQAVDGPEHRVFLLWPAPEAACEPQN